MLLALGATTPSYAPALLSESAHEYIDMIEVIILGARRLDIVQGIFKLQSPPLMGQIKHPRRKSRGVIKSPSLALVCL